MVKDFKDFIMRGNVVDMAVGIIIGVAFGAVIKSLVADVIMPPIGKLLGGVDFSNMFYALDGNSYTTLAAAQEAGAASIAYGLFINNIINFLIVAFAVFMMIRALNNMKKKEEAAPAPPKPTEKECGYCASKIPIAAKRCPMCTSELAGA